MPAYVFKTEDGEKVERRFPLGERPDEIVLDDGRRARAVPAWGGGIRLRGKGWASHPLRDEVTRQKGWHS